MADTLYLSSGQSIAFMAAILTGGIKLHDAKFRNLLA